MYNCNSIKTGQYVIMWQPLMALMREMWLGCLSLISCCRLPGMWNTCYAHFVSLGLCVSIVTARRRRVSLRLIILKKIVASFSFTAVAEFLVYSANINDIRLRTVHLTQSDDFYCRLCHSTG